MHNNEHKFTIDCYKLHIKFEIKIIKFVSLRYIFSLNQYRKYQFVSYLK